MSKIGIATITNTKNEQVDLNYGNVLQNYALTCYLKSLGHDVETIYYTTTYYESLIKQTDIKPKRGALQCIDDIIRIIKRKICRRKLSEKREDRRKLFRDFLNKEIVYTADNYESTSDFSKLNQYFDYVIVGSDQVWNPYFEGANEFYYLTYMNPQKRIAYAPSIAVESIPDELHKTIGMWISGISKISIRERAGQELLRKDYGIYAPLVCDPVFLLDKKEWLNIAADNKPEHKYFLVYLLGKKTVETKSVIKKLEKLYDITAIDLYNSDDVASAFAGPKEFISLFNNAEFILTDSFHGTAFSVILEKDFLLINRSGGKNMNSRIESILGLVGLENRNVQALLDKKISLSINWKKGELNQLVLDSKEFINDSLDLGN